MNELALFAGAGGGILGGRLLGWRTVCAVENTDFARSVLMARQNDGSLEPFPIWDDVRTFDGRPWKGRIDVVSGGFPCTDISAAGKGAGIEGEQSGLWKEMARIIGEVRPRYVFVENSPMLTSRGLGTVLGDLAALGFDTEHGVLGAHHTGAPHKRDRIWIVSRDRDRDRDREPTAVSRTQAECAGVFREDGEAHTGHSAEVCGPMADAERQQQSTASNGEEHGETPDDREADQPEGGGQVPDSNLSQREGRGIPFGTRAEHSDPRSAGWWTTESDVGRVAHGVASRMDRLTAIGNGQVPAVAALAFNTLRARLDNQQGGVSVGQSTGTV